MSSSLALISCNATFKEEREGVEGVGRREVVYHQGKYGMMYREGGRRWRGKRMGQTAGTHGRRKEREWYKAQCDKAGPRGCSNATKHTEGHKHTHAHTYTHITHPTPIQTHTHTHTHTPTPTQTHLYTHLYNTIHM